MVHGCNEAGFDENKRANVSKSTGRIAPYKLFLDIYGYGRFEKRWGETYADTNPTHKEKMGVIYESLSEEKIQYYKNRAKQLNADPEEVKVRRVSGNRDRRAIAHMKPEEMYKRKKEMNQCTKHVQETKRKENGPVFLPKLKNNEDPKLVIESDLKLVRGRSRRELIDKFLIDEGRISNKTCSYIGILNYANIVAADTFTVIAFPAEIAIVKYSLNAGVSQQHREKFRFNISELISDPTHSTEEINMSLENQANRYSKTYLIEQKRGNSIQDVVPWLLEHLQPSELNVLDAEQFVIQVETLNFIVNRLGTLEEIAEFEKLKFHSIQDVGHAIRTMPGSTVQISEKDTELYFSRNMEIKDVTNYCQEHFRFANQVKRYYQELQMCPMHQALSKIQLFFEFCADFNVCGFSFRNITEQHSLCSPHDEIVPLYVKNISLPKKLYLAHQKPILPAPVVEEKDKRIDGNIQSHECRRLMKAINQNDVPGPSRFPATPRSPSPLIASPDLASPSLINLLNWDVTSFEMVFYEVSDREWSSYSNL